MSINYLHGVETIETATSTNVVTEVKSAVIGLVGTAPQGPVNEPTVITTSRQAATFGDWAQYGLTSGYTIPAALNAIHSYGTGTVVVVNVFDPAGQMVTETPVSDEAVTFANNVATLAHKPVSKVVVKSADGTTTYKLKTDYTLDAAAGQITKVASGGLAAVESVKVSYSYTTTSGVTVEQIEASDIIGSATDSQRRTGLQALEDVFTLYGYQPKIIIAPGWSHEAGVRAAMLSLAEKMRAVALIDAPPGVSVDDCLKARGSEGDFEWQVSSDRAYLLYPQLKVYDLETDSDQTLPYSASMAGLMAYTDRNYGYWVSPSNKSLLGITGVELKISSSYSDPDCDVNRLNEQGITSVMNAYGTGYRAFGNRLSNFPSESGLVTFVSSRRVADMIAESLEQAMAQYVDSPLTAAIIDEILSVGSSFLRTLQARGAIVGGDCWVSADNTVEQLSNGQLIIEYQFTPPASLERITNKLVLTSAYYG